MARRADHIHPDVNRRRALIGMGLAAPFLATATASAEKRVSSLRIDEAELRRRGAALDGKTDDLHVLQECIDESSVTTPDMACPSILFDLPAVTICLSGPLQTKGRNLTLRGAGQDLTVLMMKAGGKGILTHGTPNEPAKGYLQLQDIGFDDGNLKGSGCTGISVHFAAEAPQAAMTWQGVALRKWSQGTTIVNCPRNWHCENVTVFGPDFAMQEAAGFRIISEPHFTQGCFTYIFINVLVANYSWAGTTTSALRWKGSASIPAPVITVGGWCGLGSMPHRTAATVLTKPIAASSGTSWNVTGRASVMLWIWFTAETSSFAVVFTSPTATWIICLFLTVGQDGVI